MAILNLTMKNIEFPKRATINSAGHDVFAHEDIILGSGEVKEIEVPMSVDFKENERVFLFLRSSIGIKKNCRFIGEKGEITPYIQVQPNQNIRVILKNTGVENVFLEKGSHYCQLVITKADNSNKEFILEKVNKVDSKISITPMYYQKREKNIQTLFLENELRIAPKEAVMIASGYKAKIDSNTFLAGFVPIEEERFIYSNGVAIGDADYYNNADNEGLYFFKIENVLDEELILKPGTAIVDLISIEFLVLENEKKPPTKIRSGGIGSTTEIEK